MSVRVARGLALALAASLGGFASVANAQWVDTKTGKPVASYPVVTDPQTGKTDWIRPNVGDRDSAFDPRTGRNFARVECGEWIDVKTGRKVASYPVITDPQTGKTDWIRPNVGDRDSAYDPRTGRNFAHQRCTPSKKTTEQPPTGSQVGSVPPFKLDPSEKRILDIHNAERAAVGAPPLRWHPALEASATAWANHLARTGQRVHAPRDGRGDVRENLNQGMLGWSTNQMMRNWLDEKSNFIPGVYPNVSTTGDWTKVSHYTQMIWLETTDIGCGMASGSGHQWLVCRYSPGGNRDGKAVGQQPVVAGVATTIEQPKAPAAYQWINTKTLKPVKTVPGGILDPHAQTTAMETGRAYNDRTGQNFAREPDGSWIDTKTLKPVKTVPGGILDPHDQINAIETGRAYNERTGQNFAREPVPAKPVK